MWTEKKVKTQLYERWHNNNHMIIFPVHFFLKYESKITDDCRVWKFLWRSVNGKHFMRKSEWKRCFEISPAQYRRGLNFSIAKDPNSWGKSNLTEIPDKKNSKIWVYLVRLSTFHEILEYASAPFANRISGNLTIFVSWYSQCYKLKQLSMTEVWSNILTKLSTVPLCFKLTPHMR